jgi:hypothetical protein
MISHMSMQKTQETFLPVKWDGIVQRMLHGFKMVKGSFGIVLAL